MARSFRDFDSLADLPGFADLRTAWGILPFLSNSVVTQILGVNKDDALLLQWVRFELNRLAHSGEPIVINDTRPCRVRTFTRRCLQVRSLIGNRPIVRCDRQQVLDNDDYLAEVSQQLADRVPESGGFIRNTKFYFVEPLEGEPDFNLEEPSNDLHAADLDRFETNKPICRDELLELLSGREFTEAFHRLVFASDLYLALSRIAFRSVPSLESPDADVPNAEPTDRPHLEPRDMLIVAPDARAIYLDHDNRLERAAFFGAALSPAALRYYLKTCVTHGHIELW